MNHYIVKWVVSYLDICVLKYPGLKEECKEHIYDAALTMHNAEMTYISKMFEMGDIEGITAYDLKQFIKKTYR